MPHSVPESGSVQVPGLNPMRVALATEQEGPTEIWVGLWSAVGGSLSQGETKDPRVPPQFLVFGIPRVSILISSYFFFCPIRGRDG